MTTILYWWSPIILTFSKLNDNYVVYVIDHLIQNYAFKMYKKQLKAYQICQFFSPVCY